MARLKEIYNKDVVPALVKQFGYKSTMQVPRIEKIVLNMGVGEAIADKKILENASGDLQKIATENTFDDESADDTGETTKKKLTLLGWPADVIAATPYDPMGWFGGDKTPQSEFCP